MEIGSFAREQLVLNSFPKESDRQLVYKTPSRFLKGKYCPALVEAYWMRLNELKETSQKIGAYKRDKLKEKLKKLWDES